MATAGRLVGAFRRLGKDTIAQEITSSMNAADYVVRETDPFETDRAFTTIAPAKAPIIGRLQALGAINRQSIIDVFPRAPGPQQRR